MAGRAILVLNGDTMIAVTRQLFACLTRLYIPGDLLVVLCITSEYNFLTYRLRGQRWTACMTADVVHTDCPCPV